MGTPLSTTVEETAAELYVRALKLLPPDVKQAIDRAAANETHPTGRDILAVIQQNIRVAEDTDNIVCQDTGTPVFYLRRGDQFPLGPAQIVASIREGVRRATAQHALRPNVVHPIARANTLTNVGRRVPVVHFEFVPDSDCLQVLMVPKGSGSENQSFLKMLIPADGLPGVKKFVLESVVAAAGNPCPPTVVGVGVGGTFELCAALAKQAAVRPVGRPHPDPDAAALERELLAAINDTGIGPMGLGGDTTALAVHVELADTHITQLPVAVNCQCWAARRAAARLRPTGEVEYAWALD